MSHQMTTTGDIHIYIMDIHVTLNVLQECILTFYTLVVKAVKYSLITQQIVALNDLNNKSYADEVL